MASCQPLPNTALNMSRPVFLLLGFASEYSLGGMAQLLRDAGENVVEVDFSVTAMPNLGDTKIVLITSQHPARTGRIFRQGLEQDPSGNSYLSPMECQRLLNVCCSVFVPHDLEQPIIADEIGYLQLFDFYCSPYEFNPGLYLLCQPLYTGWVKYIDGNSDEFAHKSTVATNGVFFVNQVIDLMRRGGARYLLERYAVAIKHEVPFKLPSWPGVSDIEKTLEQAGAKVIPANTPSTQVIDHAAQVFSNTTGSVLSEAAYLGIPAHIVAPYASTLPSPPPRGRRLKSFDIQLLIQAIRSHLDRTSQP